MINDRVGDFITRLTNAGAVRKETVVLPYSSHLEAIARKLKELGFVGAVSKEGEEGKKRMLVVGLLYDERGNAKIRGVKRVSKPGRRLYVGHDEAYSVMGGTGARLISTPAGVLSDREARKNRAGGENLFEIW